MGGSARFPSGEWVGFYVNPGCSERFLVELSLTFEDGKISGDGWDDVGLFVIHGIYSDMTLNCILTKTYIPHHPPKVFICGKVLRRSVDYFGCRDGKGIWGRWQLPRPPRTKGGFHIWPIDRGDDFEGVFVEQGWVARRKQSHAGARGLRR